jgi:putative two-component system response regulator
MKNKPLILIVDDFETSRNLLIEILGDDFSTVTAEDGAEALQYLTSDAPKPAAVLLDILMPVMDGYEVLTAMQADKNLCEIPVICISVSEDEYKGLHLGAVDYIKKPFNTRAVRLRVSNQVELSAYRQSMESLVSEKAQELTATKEKLLEILANMIEYRCIETSEHINRTKKITEIFLFQIRDNHRFKPELEVINIPILVQASALHDIGKIGIPDSILLKPGKLTADEFKIIETHTTLGSEIFESLVFDFKNDVYFDYCQIISRYHHERWDGKGYPDKLKQEEIPLMARIVALVDVYDALVSERVYKKAFTHDQAVGIIKSESGSHFDPGIVDAFIACESKIKRI